MSKQRRGTMARVGVILVGMLLIGGSWTGVATAQATDPVTDVTDVVTTDAGTDATTDDATTDDSNPVTDAVTSVTDALTDGAGTLTQTLTDLATTSGTTDQSATAVTETQYVQVPSDSYGHRKYGHWYDDGCGCDRYSTTPTAQQPVYASQVSSVPTGGVSTGDGSFQ